ncbi:YybH family protein [Paludisphaera soli]|uniref:YybH family protein n=1 Tax=Paludisphaera soli TaxID=2712865 RepID=UPI0013EA9581|nr:SgcJ/EcaC family oxidoreductase [Paludisphaera soli]
MKRLATACLLIACIGVPALGQGPTKEDDAAVREVVRRYVEAREARDAQAVEALLTPDADQLVSDGTWRRGRESLVQGMLESSRKNPAKRTIDVESVRLLAPDVAIADGRYTQVAAATDVRAMWTTIVARRTPEGWKIAAIRNMLPAAPAK